MSEYAYKANTFHNDLDSVSLKLASLEGDLIQQLASTESFRMMTRKLQIQLQVIFDYDSKI